MVLAFIARDIADWVGIPVAVVIAGMVILRRRAKELASRRRQARESRRSSPE
jgi:hypothetical protein